MGYSFELLTKDGSANYIRETVENLEAKAGQGWPCWAISNHDVERVATRWGGKNPSPILATQLTAMLCSLRGSTCVYQGEELGLTEAEIAFEDLQDPYGIAFWPNFKGRDGCRTPMPWDASVGAGFSNTAPWLPIPAEHRTLSVAEQEKVANSRLNQFRHFMRWRQQQPALKFGSIQFVQSDEPILAFIREYNGQKLLAMFNLSAHTVDCALPVAGAWQALSDHGLVSAQCDNQRLHFPAHGVWYAVLN